MFEHSLSLIKAARALSASPLDIVTACAEGKLKCQVSWRGKWTMPTQAQIAAALEKGEMDLSEFIEMERGAISWYLGATGHPRPPQLNEIQFLESEIDRIRAELKSKRAGSRAVTAEGADTREPARDRASSKRQPADPEKVAAVLNAAKKEMSGLDLKRASAKWLRSNQWNLTQVAKRLKDENTHLPSAKTIRNILSKHRAELPLPAVKDKLPARAEK